MKLCTVHFRHCLVQHSSGEGPQASTYLTKVLRQKLRPSSCKVGTKTSCRRHTGSHITPGLARKCIHCASICEDFISRSAPHTFHRWLTTCTAFSRRIAAASSSTSKVGWTASSPIEFTGHPIVQVGQFLGARGDFMPLPVCEQLSRLHDQVSCAALEALHCALS